MQAAHAVRLPRAPAAAAVAGHIRGVVSLTIRPCLHVVPAAEARAGVGVDAECAHHTEVLVEKEVAVHDGAAGEVGQVRAEEDVGARRDDDDVLRACNGGGFWSRLDH